MHDEHCIFAFEAVVHAILTLLEQNHSLPFWRRIPNSLVRHVEQVV